jgi:hypothetical protein
MMQQPGVAGVGAPQPDQQQQYQQQQQQWMMQQQQQSQPVPPPAGWNPPPVPPPTQYGAAAGSGGDGDEIKSLWIGDLQQWMDENYLLSIFSATGEVIQNLILVLNFFKKEALILICIIVYVPVLEKESKFYGWFLYECGISFLFC